MSITKYDAHPVQEIAAFSVLVIEKLREIQLCVPGCTADREWL